MQSDLFTSVEEARRLATAGANLAAAHMDRLTNGEWTEAAYRFMLTWISDGKVFQTYQLREASEGKIPGHPGGDARCWGAIILAASKNGVIRSLGYAPTGHKESHGRKQEQWTAVNLQRA